MSYIRIKPLGAYCPNCSRKLELLLPDLQESSTAIFAICFKCKSLQQFSGNDIIEINHIKKLPKEQQAEVKELVEHLPDKYRYQAKGSQLYYHEESATFKRRWLSLAAYEKTFMAAAPENKCDFRQNKQQCKWCGNALTASRRSFCKDACSRAYGKATYFNRTMATLPYRIACRDAFFCCGTGEDLALTNKFGRRIPASNGHLEVHHLILVSEGGTDHESNLITISETLHRQYHQGEKKATDIINHLRDQQLARYRENMIAEKKDDVSH